MVNNKIAVRFFSICLVVSMLIAPWQTARSGVPAQPASAYIEPALLAQQSGEVSVILTAGSAQAAANAVRQSGGRVTAELGLIDAVAANIPTQGLVEPLTAGWCSFSCAE